MYLQAGCRGGKLQEIAKSDLGKNMVKPHRGGQPVAILATCLGPLHPQSPGKGTTSLRLGNPASHCHDYWLNHSHREKAPLGCGEDPSPPTSG